MHFVLSLNANAGTAIDSLLKVKKIFINRGREYFSSPRAARTLVTPLDASQYVRAPKRNQKVAGWMPTLV